MSDFSGFQKPKSNYSKLPHAFINLLHKIKSVSEIKVVLYTLRHTWGFSEYGSPKRITIDEFMNGRKKSDGSRMDLGTGLSGNSIRSGIDAAIEHGLLIVQIDRSDLARIKKYYSLRMDTQNLNPDAQTLNPDAQELSIDQRKILKKETIIKDKVLKAVKPPEKKVPKNKSNSSKPWTWSDSNKKYKPLADAFEKCHRPSLNIGEMIFWINGKARTNVKGLKHFYELGISPATLTKAYDRHMKKKLDFSGPGSIFYLADKLHQANGGGESFDAEAIQKKAQAEHKERVGG